MKETIEMLELKREKLSNKVVKVETKVASLQKRIDVLELKKRELKEEIQPLIAWTIPGINGTISTMERLGATYIKDCGDKYQHFFNKNDEEIRYTPQNKR